MYGRREKGARESNGDFGLMTARRRRRRSKKWAYWLVVLALVAVAAGVGYKVWDEYFRDDNGTSEVVDSGGSGKEPAEVVKPKEDVGGKEENIDENENTDEEVLPPAKPQYDGANPNTSNGVTGVITYAGVSDGVLVVRVNIDQYLSGGSCALALAQDGASLYEETVKVVDLAATSTCEGFNVPVTKINRSGEVGIRIMVTSGEKSGIIESEVNL